MTLLDELRAAWHKASEKDRPNDAVRALVELERLEASEPRWSQRLGESYRRLGKTPEAVDAFARAFQRYFDQGFLPRAIAMAKLVRSLDAARGDLLEASLPRGGPGVPPPLGLGRGVGAPAPAKPAPSPAVAPSQPSVPGTKPPRAAPPQDGPREPEPFEMKRPPSVKPPPLPSPPVRPVPLTLAEDSAIDEVRFSDAPDSSVEILLSDFVNASRIHVEVDVEVEEEDAPPTLDAAAPEPVVEDAEVDTYATMATFRLFARLSRDALLALSNAAELVEFVPGAMIVVRDERAFALYAIVAGSARVIVKGASSPILLKEGDVFGEASLLDEGRRQADVRAETPLMTLRIEKRALDEVMKEHPEVEDALFDLLARRLITNLMHASPLFAAFDPPGQLELAQRFEVRRAPPGTVLAERGRRSDGLYVLLAGNVVAEESGAAAPVRVARGTAFGHASLLGGRTADTTIRSVSEAVLLRMPAAQFSSLAALYPPVLAHLAETADEPLPESRRDPFAP
jgi:CRP-like cAMP-binding protein